VAAGIGLLIDIGLGAGEGIGLKLVFQNSLHFPEIGKLYSKNTGGPIPHFSSRLNPIA
jgi:hypothetical protein